MASLKTTTALLMVVALLTAAAAATTFKVGDDFGWDTGVDYGAWASGKKFKVGDTLEFLYAEGAHNVVVVDAQGYDACAAPGNAPTLSSGDDTVALRQAGRSFFICGVEGHCQAGMKLAVDVE